MAHWGIALANGPHINNPDVPRAARRRRGRRSRARDSAAGASAAESALIEALAARYADPPPGRPVAARRGLRRGDAQGLDGFPTDADVGALFAEALMNLAPGICGRRTASRSPAPRRSSRRSRRCSRPTPNHPVANHLYIHAVEASPNPETRRSRPPTPARAPARRRAPRPHAVAHLHPPRPLAGGGRGQRAGHRGRPGLRARVPGTGSTGSTWPTTTTCSPTRR